MADIENKYVKPLVLNFFTGKAVTPVVRVRLVSTPTKPTVTGKNENPGRDTKTVTEYCPTSR